MSKLPPITSVPKPQTPSTHRNFLPPIISPPPPSQHLRFNPIVYESQLSDFTHKLIQLEQANAYLANRLNTTEQSHNYELKQLQSQLSDETTKRKTLEQLITTFTETNLQSTNELNSKLNSIQQTIDNETNAKTQQRNHDKELYQNVINIFSSKISEMITKEVENRFSADLENKIYTESITNKFSNEIDKIKIDINNTYSQTKHDIETISNECSERSHNLSKYIDQQISEAINGKHNSTEMLKNFVHKLTTQFKSNISLQNTQNETTNNKLHQLEQDIKSAKIELKEHINSIEKHILTKIHDVKTFTELNIQKEHNTFTNAITTLSTNTDNYLEELKQQLINTRNVLGFTLTQMEASSTKQLNCFVNDLERVWERVFIYEDLLKEYNEQNKKMKEEYEYNIRMFNNKFDIWCVNERMIYTIENNKLQNEIELLKEEHNKTKVELTENITNLNDKTENEFENVYSQISSLNNRINKYAERIGNDLNEFKERTEVQLLLDEMLLKVENEYVFDIIQNSKCNIDDIQSQCIQHQNDINTLKANINTYDTQIIPNINNEISDLNTLINKNAVSLTMNNILSKIDLNHLHNEHLNLLQHNENKFMQEIHKVKDDINVNNNNIHKEIEKINKLLGKSLKNKDKQLNDTTAMEIKAAMNEMITNVEVAHLYDIINNNCGVSQKEVNDAVNNAISKQLELNKNEHINMWTNAVELAGKVGNAEEVKKCIGKIPAVVYSKEDTVKRMSQLEFGDDTYEVPFNPQLYSNIRNIAQKNDNDNNYNYNDGAQQVLV